MSFRQDESSQPTERIVMCTACADEGRPCRAGDGAVGRGSRDTLTRTRPPGGPT